MDGETIVSLRKQITMKGKYYITSGSDNQLMVFRIIRELDENEWYLSRKKDHPIDQSVDAATNLVLPTVELNMTDVYDEIVSMGYKLQLIDNDLIVVSQHIVFVSENTFTNKKIAIYEYKKTTHVIELIRLWGKNFLSAIDQNKEQIFKEQIVWIQNDLTTNI